MSATNFQFHSTMRSAAKDCPDCMPVRPRERRPERQLIFTGCLHTLIRCSAVPPAPVVREHHIPARRFQVGHDRSPRRNNARTRNSTLPTTRGGVFQLRA
jgi:hypothetical protein